MSHENQDQLRADYERLQQEVALLKAENAALGGSLAEAEADRDAYQKCLHHYLARDGMNETESEHWFRQLFARIAKGEEKLLSSEEAMDYLFGKDANEQLKRSA